MREKLLEVLGDIRADIDFETETNLIDGNVLDSFDIISTVSAINDEFDINLKVQDLVPENLNSLEAMITLIESYE